MSRNVLRLLDSVQEVMAALVRPSQIVQEFRAARRRPDLAVLEGFHAIKHAQRFGATLDVLVGTNRAELNELAEVFAPELHAQLTAKLEVVPPEVFSDLAPHAPQTGIIGIAQRPEIDVTDVLFNPTPRPIVLLEDPRNLHNAGACVRVAAAGDAAGVLTTGMHDPWHPDAIRAAAGLHFALPVCRVDQMRFGDRPVIAVDPNGERFRPRNMPPRTVLAFGTERYGISVDLLARADDRVAIPMRTGVSSLNVATSVAAILFAWRLDAA